MKFTIYKKITLINIVFTLIAVIFLCTFTQMHTTIIGKNQATSRLADLSNLIYKDYAKDFFENKISKKEAELHTKNYSQSLNVEIWLLDKNGKKITHLPTDTTKDCNLNTNIFYDEKNKINSEYPAIYGDCDGKMPDNTLSFCKMVTKSKKTQGYIIISLNESFIADSVDSYMLTIFQSTLILIIILWIILLFVKLTLYRRFCEIMKTVYSYSQGDFSKKINHQYNDELGYLSNTLDYMANELDTLEDEERIFVSNVSHDFRSPLTSIKGYVEAIMDGTIPVEIQDQYLQIILDETNRLSKLTESLLDLNQFGKNGAKLNISTFDINEVILATTRVFGVSLKKKNLSIKTKLEPGALFVEADIDKIQQVIYNLVDNAIKFSFENNSIDFETYVKHGKVFVSIKDHGIGISSENQKKIWDRFYKIDASRGKNKMGAGLGLSIVKAIISAHSENINVISTPGAGTEFIFTLTKSE